LNDILKVYIPWRIMGGLMGILGVSTIQSGEINWMLVLAISSIFLINYRKKEKEH